MKKIFSLLSILFLLYSCNQEIKISPQLNKMLEKAGNNRSELEKVINYYKKQHNNLKLEAAYFLIENMEGQCYATTKIVDTTGTEVDFNVLDYPDYKTMVAAWDSLEKIVGPIDFARDTLIFDVNIISSKFLIENIELAFKAWHKPWARMLTFDEFKEYILPYRSSNEPLENWRKTFYEKYTWVADSVKDPTDPIEACTLINSDIISWFDFDARFYRHPTDLGLSEMFKYKKGRCEDMTNLAIYAMRSQGIPVMSDYTPAWPNTGNNHAWNATLDKNKKVIIFMGGESNPYDYKLGNKKAKVYRKTFGIQKNSLAETAPDYERLPGWLASRHYIDVTTDYIPVCNVNITLTEPKPDSINYAYISVFNSGEWKAIHWGKIKNDSVTYTNMGMDIAYLPTYYKNGELLPANYPFILDTNANVNFIIPDTNNTQTIKLYSTTRRVIVMTTDEIRKAAFEPGTEYDLFYWNKKWIKLASAITEKDKPLTFENVPTNALFWLVKKDSKKEERIFTINSSGEQVWW
jgi:hypothetical protein